MPPQALHRAHRARFLEVLSSHQAAALIPTARAKVRSHDTEYPFRPSSDFWYLTGFDEPEAALLLLPARAGHARGESVLFLRERKREEEIWTGRRLGVERACAALEVDRAFPIGELWTRLPDLLEGARELVAPQGADEEFDRQLAHALNVHRARTRASAARVSALRDPAEWLHELRLSKNEAEIACMREAAAITDEAHRAALAAARPGVREFELDALLTWVFRRRGASGPAYQNIVAAGDNACVLHYRAGERALAAGELVLIDAGAEFAGYACDVTRTFPADGHFQPRARALYEVVLDAQKAALAGVRPGATIEGLHEVALERLIAGLLRLELLSGTPEEVRASGAYRRFYMHRTSHWLGLDVHDCGAYAVGGAPRPLQPGMVLTIEPGLYVAPDDEEVDPAWRGIGIRIEDDALVTPDGAEVLTAAIPKEVDEIERACAAELAAWSPPQG